MHAGHIAYLCFFGVAVLWLLLTPEVPATWDPGELPDYCVLNTDAVGAGGHGNAGVRPDVSARSH